MPTGVALGEGSRVVVMMDSGGVGTALVGRLEKLGAAVLSIEDAPQAEELVARLDGFAADGPVQGVYWLPALDLEAPIEDMDLAAWREALRMRVKLLYATMRHLYDSVGEAGTFLVSATRLGGRHGYDDVGAVAPLGGAVTGFTKAFKREKPDALVKAVDFPASRKTAALAEALIAETRARSRGRRDRPYRRSAVHDRAARRGAAVRDRQRPARPRLRCGRDRSRRQHRVGDHGGPRSCIRRHVPPSRPGA